MAKKKQQAMAVAKTEAMLARLKSYECWVNTAGADALQWAEKEYGSPRQFYDWFRAVLIKIATGVDEEIYGRTSF